MEALPCKNRPRGSGSHTAQAGRRGHPVHRATYPPPIDRPTHGRHHHHHRPSGSGTPQVSHGADGRPRRTPIAAVPPGRTSGPVSPKEITGMNLWRRLSGPRRALALAGASTLVAGGLVTIPVTAAQAATQCNITYTQQRVAGWLHRQRHHPERRRRDQRLDPRLHLPQQQPAGAARAGRPTWTQSGSQVTATNMSYNGTLATGASTSIGFNGAWSGSNPTPTSFTLNGVVCNGGPPTTADHAVRPTGPTTGPTHSARPTRRRPTPPARRQGRQPVRGCPGLREPGVEGQGGRASPAAAGSPTTRPPSGSTGSPRSRAPGQQLQRPDGRPGPPGRGARPGCRLHPVRDLQPARPGLLRARLQR